MNQYILLWLKVVDGMNNDNTYKLAWGRALIEICHSYEIPKGDSFVINFNQVSEYFLKYFWNQTYFFKLYQGPARSKPVIQQITEEMIEYYQTQTQTKKPVWFDIAHPILMSDPKKYNRFINSISTAIKTNVSHRFLNVSGEKVRLYDLDESNRTVTFTKEEFLLLKDHAFVLSQLLNYRWAQLLEKFNTSPRIAMKVKGISEEQLRRNNLNKFKHALLRQFPDGIVKDFYSGDILDPNDISIDHVIPWSFMYSDDIWNLVITSKSRNSSKSDILVSPDVIKQLKQRNNVLKDYVGSEYKDQLVIAEEHGYLDKFYFQFKI